MTNRMPELLCPAGNLESLEAALHFGADAVYGGMKQFGLRAFAGNFDEDALTQAVEKMHGAGKKFYLTMNIFPFDDQLDDFIAAAKAARDIGVDAAIVSDLGAIAALRREVPELPLHVSTQASTVNAEAVRVYRDMGCERVILARETSIARAKEIIRRVPEMEIETFVHGASCMAYSGRCLLSAAMAGRSGNQGECAQPCRWHYSVVEEKRPGEYMPVCEDENGTYIFSAHDLNLMPLLPELTDAGIKSLKIEGRMKTAYYVATVTAAYRRALDLLADGGDFAAALPRCSMPVCYNGDLITERDVSAVSERYPDLPAVMIGRALIADPSLVMRLTGGKAADAKMLETFHDTLFVRYCEAFGDSRIAMLRMKEIWFYHLNLFENSEKTGKAIKKAKNAAEFQSAAAAVFRDCRVRANAVPLWFKPA